MVEKLYKLIPEDGKHLADSKDTLGAVRGVYLDNETNKPCGAGEFVPVESSNTSGISPATVSALVTLALASGYAIAKATPYVVKWVRGTAIPWVKRTWNSLWKSDNRDTRSKSLELTDHCSYVLKEAVPEDLLDEVIYEHRENMTHEEAVQRLIDAFILILKGYHEANRVSNANIIFPSGEIVDGQKLILDESVIAQINAAIQQNPELLSLEQRETLSRALGYEVFKNGEFQPLTVQALSNAIM